MVLDKNRLCSNKIFRIVCRKKAYILENNRYTRNFFKFSLFL